MLEVISRSPSDIQPVLDTIAETAQRLCQSEHAYVMRLDRGRYYPAAAKDARAERIQYLREHPIAVDRGSVCGRVALERRTIHVTDALADPDYTLSMAGDPGYRTILGVPLLRDGVAIGVIVLTRAIVRPFTDEQIELVSTFADQALIAIENVRLFEAEQAAYARAVRIARAADGGIGGSAAHKQLTGRTRAGLSDHARERGTYLRRQVWNPVPARGGCFSRCCDP